MFIPIDELSSYRQYSIVTIPLGHLCNNKLTIRKLQYEIGESLPLDFVVSNGSAINLLFKNKFKDGTKSLEYYEAILNYLG